jgi:hypothetical protein
MKTIACLIFMCLFAIYAIFGDKPFLFNSFWRSFIWIIAWGFSATLLIFGISKEESLFDISVQISAIILLTLLCIFYLLLINTTKEQFNRLCNYWLLAYAFAAFVPISILISYIIKILK